MISIIVPTYNRARFLSETIESAFQQTVGEFELIIVDDGSTDETSSLIKGYSTRDPRIRYFFQNQAGPAAARNFGINRSTGEWIAFLDSDDLWSPGKLSAQLNAAEMHPEVDFIYCAGHVVSEDGTPLVERTSRLCPDKLYTAESILMGNVKFLTSGVMFRRKCLDQSGQFDPALEVYEDVDLWFRILLFHRSFFVDQDLVTKRELSSGFSRSYLTPRLHRCILQMRRKAIPLFESRVRQLTSAERETAYYHYQRMLIKEYLAFGWRLEIRQEIAWYQQSHPLPGAFYYLLSLIPGRIVPRLIAWRRRWLEPSER